MTIDETSDVSSDGGGQMELDRRTVLVGAASIAGASMLSPILAGSAVTAAAQAGPAA